MAEKYKKNKIKRLFWVKVEHGEDLLQALSRFCERNKIKIGFISIIGALQRATFSYYDQAKKKYCKNIINKPVEILSCIGNVSIKEGKPFVHAHLNVAGKSGKSFGGHLEKGNVVFACECALFELKGDSLKREFDKKTELFLWKF